MDGGSRLVAVHTRHLAIHQNDVERLSLDGVETVLSVAGYVDTTADALEQARAMS